ncbi:MAG: HD domain-containing phosphohydrolase [Eubacteriales bacterium]
MAGKCIDRCKQQDLLFRQKFEELLSFMHKISTARPNFEELLLLFSELGKKLADADRSSIWLVSEDKKSLWTKVGTGLSESIVIPIGTGSVGKSIADKEPYITSDAYLDPSFNKNVDLKTGYRTKAILTIPFINQDGEAFGAFQLVNKTGGARDFFNEDDIYISQLVAEYVKSAILEKLAEEELASTQKEIIFLLADVIDSRSGETGEHVKRVAHMSQILAKLCGLSDDEANMLKMTSTLHDVGKIGIPDNVLNKPGKLTDEEYDIIKNHTTIGYELLQTSNNKFLKFAAMIAHEHHEKYNGFGYPMGKKGDEINIHSKIVTIADVFDALYNKRVYKDPMPFEKVMEIMDSENKNTFDPDIYRYFRENIDLFLEVQEKYRNETYDRN